MKHPQTRGSVSLSGAMMRHVRAAARREGASVSEIVERGLVATIGAPADFAPAYRGAQRLPVAAPPPVPLPVAESPPADPFFGRSWPQKQPRRRAPRERLAPAPRDGNDAPVALAADPPRKAADLVAPRGATTSDPIGGAW